MTLRDLTLRVATLLAWRRADRELADELAFHIERETRKLVDGGLAPAEARSRALARFGSIALTAEQAATCYASHPG